MSSLSHCSVEMKILLAGGNLNGVYKPERPIVASMFYNIQRDDLQLNIQLVSDSQQELLMCSTWSHQKPNLWKCNETLLGVADSFRERLDPNRIERCITLEFSCNSSCRSMPRVGEGTVLRFSIIDDTSTMHYYTDVTVCINDNQNPARKMPEGPIQ